MNKVNLTVAHSDSSQSDCLTGSLTVGDARLGWAAGFLDGEGCIHIAKQIYSSRRSCTYRLGVHVTQNDRSALEHFRRVVGIDAPIYLVKRAANHRRQCYTLNFSGEKALHLLNKLLPFLQRKYLEAKAAIGFWAESRVGGRRGKRVEAELTAIREFYFELLKKLK